MTRPNDTTRSYTVRWRGNTPEVEESNWAVDYTPGHRESPEAAIAMEMIKLTDLIAAFREKWLNINMLAENISTPITADKVDAEDINPELIRAGVITSDSAIPEGIGENLDITTGQDQALFAMEDFQ